MTAEVVRLDDLKKLSRVQKEEQGAQNRALRHATENDGDARSIGITSDELRPACNIRLQPAQNRFAKSVVAAQTLKKNVMVHAVKSRTEIE